jgi:hypothetical protein
MDIFESDAANLMEELLHSSHRVLEAGIWLIRHGYGKMAQGKRMIIL